MTYKEAIERAEMFTARGVRLDKRQGEAEVEEARKSSTTRVMAVRQTLVDDIERSVRKRIERM